ncbi:MAG TPA: DUF6542 domain-containing protein [Streptosporangiaceae bacterium]|nr:DUF6542 domain-containing protein [Streptosporangiaceae bacterium]
MSQPWHETPRSPRRPGSGHSSPNNSLRGIWAREKVVLPGAAAQEKPGRDAEDAAVAEAHGADSMESGSGKRQERQTFLAAGRHGTQASSEQQFPPPRAPRAAGTDRRRVTLTGRGAVLGMFALFFVCLLIGSSLQWGFIVAGSYLIGSVGAAWYTKRQDLLVVAVTPPLLFFCALVCAKALSAKGNALVSTAEGTVLTLASVALWLFLGTAGNLVVCWLRGLPECIAELRREMRPDRSRPRPGGTFPGDRDPVAR